MYLARTTHRDGIHYSIRESFKETDCWKSRTLFDLGTDPSEYIHYPGGVSYYYDPAIEDALDEMGASVGPDDLDRVFWDFLDPETQRVILGFQRNWRRHARAKRDTEPKAGVHLFDKRRVHFLRCGQMDQRRIGQVPPRFFRQVWDKSRDEIEQLFTEQEGILKPRERLMYVYAIFDLQRCVNGPLSKQNPAIIEKPDLDACFMETLCDLNEDAAFWKGYPGSEGLDDYLVKYVIMYFDGEFPRPTFMEDYVRQFINSHRRYVPPRSVQIKIEEAAKLFGVSWKTLKDMDRRELVSLYRKKAMAHHPDVGGDQETFVKLTDYFQALLRKK